MGKPGIVRYSPNTEGINTDGRNSRRGRGAPQTGYG